ncbi:hypothetical protein ARMGADRAFT_1037594 [Armillaria gallica]|uniref:Uncharacterized protein n=1 Tax=Armillaria gallica TaxID=47427 RepID=A0A2H3D6Q7_ARMGA|nr:hypothetical protein ARMGADRAFT_1037594 [Armillaria gallica]
MSYSSVIEHTLQHLPHLVWFKNSHIWLSTVSQFVRSLKNDPSAICWCGRFRLIAIAYGQADDALLGGHEADRKARLEEQQVKVVVAWHLVTISKRKPKFGAHIDVVQHNWGKENIPVLAQTVNLTSMQSALTCLREITDADPNWFGRMTPFMCAEYTRIRDINNYRKMRAFERAYEVEVGELGPEGVYSAVLMLVLKVTSNGSIVSNWEARPNGGMVDEWESDDEGEEEGVSTADLQVGHDFYTQVASRVVAGARLVGDCDDIHVAAGSLYQADLPQRVAAPSSFGIGDQSACNCMNTHHTRLSDLKEEIPLGIGKEEDCGRLGLQGGPEMHGNMFMIGQENQNTQGWDASVFQKIKKQCVFQLAEWKTSMMECCEKRRVNSAQQGSSGWRHRHVSRTFLGKFKMECGQGMPSDWTEAHTHSLYDSILADPIQRTKNMWTPTHIQWMMKSIWFCDKTARLSRVTGMDASILRRQWATVFSSATPVFERTQSVVPVSTRTYQILLANLATSDPMSLDAETGPSDGEGNDDEDMGYGAAQPSTSPMEVDPPAAPEGKPSRDKTGEEWRVVSEMRADLAGVQVAATLAGLVTYGASSDDGSGEEEEVEEEVEQKRQSSAERKKEEKDYDADDEREEEEEVDELEGGGASDAAPALKQKGYTCTGWLVDLNQHLRQGKTQLAMCTYMVEMEEESLLETRSVADAMVGIIASCP